MSNRCFGIGDNLKRCEKKGKWRFFCEDHEYQWMRWISFLIFTVIAGSASIYSVIPLLFIADRVSQPSYESFLSMSYVEQTAICRDSNYADNLLNDICSYLSRKHSRKTEIERSGDRKEITIKYIKQNKENIKNALSLYIKAYGEESFLIDENFVEYGNEKCSTDKEMEVLRGVLLTYLYYSSFKFYIEENIPSEYGVSPIASPRYISDSEYQKPIVRINPYDIVEADVIGVSDILQYLPQIRKKDMRAIISYLIKLKKYGDYYTETKRRLFYEKELDSFLNDAEFGSWMTTGRGGTINLERYNIHPIEECDSIGGYLNFRHDGESSYWSYSMVFDMYSFWFRRDLDGSIFRLKKDIDYVLALSKKL